MPEHLRALVVILALATAVFAFARAPACALASTTRDFERRCGLWFGITLAAFLAHNFWIFILVASMLLLFAIPREPNKLAMFFFLLFAVPPFSAEITGLGVIRYVFDINYPRLLALAVLLPAFLFLWKQPDSDRFGRLLPDKLIAGYIILQFILMLSATTFTNTLRFGAFYAFIDIFLPYYVASRSLKNLQGFRDALMAFAVAALVLSVIGAFEFAKHWLLYSYLDDALGVRWEYGHYLARGAGGSLRAEGSAGQPIALGYVVAVAMGLFLYLRKSVPNLMAWILGLLLLILGLISPVSRGPWVGAAAMLLVFIAIGPSPARSFAKLTLLSAIILPVLLVSSAGEKIIDLLPFVGTVELSNITYRQRFTEISIQFIMQHPFFGAYDYIYAPEMDVLKPQGLLDTLNVFLTVGLGSGLVGLSLFAGFFIAVAVGIFKRMRSLADRNDELYLLGRALFCTLLGIVIILNTVSPITIIPVVYWSVAGVGVAYARMLAPAKAPAKTPGLSRRAGFQPAAMKIRT